MVDVADSGLPVPESTDLGRYLEDTITIDWQTPTVSDQGRALVEGCASPEARVRSIFAFVRDEIRHSLDHDDRVTTCSASQVLRAGTGLCYAKSHLLAGLLRFAGFPTGFCYVRLVDHDRPGRFVLHGFNAVYWAPSRTWLPLDARGALHGVRTEVRFEPPWSLAYAPDPALDEGFLPAILRRPGKRVVDLLERAPDFDAVRRNLPDAL